MATEGSRSRTSEGSWSEIPPRSSAPPGWIPASRYSWDCKGCGRRIPAGVLHTHREKGPSAPSRLLDRFIDPELREIILQALVWAALLALLGYACLAPRDYPVDDACDGRAGIYYHYSNDPC